MPHPFLKKLPFTRTASKIINLYFMQLGSILDKVDRLTAGLEGVLRNEASLLQASIDLTEVAAHLQQVLAVVEARQRRVLSHLENLSRESGEQNNQMLRSSVQALGENLTQSLQGWVGEQNHQLLRSLHALFRETEANRPIVKTSDYDLLNPELGLMRHLYSYLSERNAIDVGANVGDVSERLIQSGYRVHAFEPYPPVFKLLQQRLRFSDNFHASNVAVGPTDAEMELFLAADTSGNDKHRDTTLYHSLVRHSMTDELVFNETMRVPVRSLHSLACAREIPAEIGLLKIDTEGYDLEVIRGLGTLRPAILMAEFWDSTYPFGRSGALNRLDMLVAEMRRRGYDWHLVAYRSDSARTSFYCNRDQSLEGTWGNVLFFRERTLFAEGLQWCSAVIPVTYFGQ